jgi:hypothetical protein
MSLVTVHTGAFGNRLMNTADASIPLILIVTGQTDGCRRLIEHPGIFAGVLVVAGLAVSHHHRRMLCHLRDIIMTHHTQTALNLGGQNRLTIKLVAAVTVSATNRLMDHFTQQTDIR